MIHDPRTPHILLWLSAMEPKDAACVMTAMRDTFPILRGNTQWARQVEQMSAGMSERERARMAKRAARIGQRVGEVLSKQLGYPHDMR